MPVSINGKTYYRTAEVCQMVGISRSTFFRWLREGTLADASNTDRRGWRLFTAEELQMITGEANMIKPHDQKNNTLLRNVTGRPAAKTRGAER